MRKIALLQAASFLILCSCNNSNNEDRLKAINQSLIRSNEMIHESSSQTYLSMTYALSEQSKKARGEIWFPKADKIHSLTSNMIKYMESFKRQLSLNYEIKIGSDEKLFDQLELYKKNLLSTMDTATLNISTSWKMQFIEAIKKIEKNIPIYPDTSSNQEIPPPIKQAYRNANSLKKTNLLSITTVLNKLENDVFITENILTQYCNDQLAVIVENFTKFRAIAVINSTYLKEGQEIEVTAGVGGFDDVSKPKITINNILVPGDQDGVSEYKFTAKGKPGEHKIPVTINYIDPNGTQQMVTKIIKYYIVK